MLAGKIAALSKQDYVASGAFFCHVLRILLSEFHEDPKEPSLGIKERSCVIGMFVIIMRRSAEGHISSR